MKTNITSERTQPVEWGSSSSPIAPLQIVKQSAGVGNPFADAVMAVEESPSTLFHHTGICLTKAEAVAVNLVAPVSTVTQGFCFYGLCGRNARRVSLSTRGVTSWWYSGLRRFSCCMSAELRIQSGMGNLASTSFPFEGIEDGIRSIISASNTAHGPVSDGSSHVIQRVGECNPRSFVDCMVRSTAWHFGPGSSVRVETNEKRCGYECFFTRSTISGALAERVRMTEAFSSVGICACRETPSGRCSREDYVSLKLSDGNEIYGGVKRGEARMILMEISQRRRKGYDGGETTSLSIRGSDSLTFCCGNGSELTITSEKITLVLHNQAPCERQATCGLFMGAFATTMLIEDVVSVEVLQPKGCDIAGNSLNRMGKIIFRLYRVLNCGSNVGFIFAILILAGLIGVVLYAGSLGDRGQNERRGGGRFSLHFLPTLFPGWGDEAFLVVAASALTVSSLFFSGADPAVLFGNCYGIARELITLFFSLLVTPFNFLFPCFHRSVVVIRGLHGSLTFKVRPAEDAQMNSEQLASKIMDTIEQLNSARRFNSASTGEGKPRSSGSIYMTSPKTTGDKGVGYALPGSVAVGNPLNSLSAPTHFKGL